MCTLSVSLFLHRFLKLSKCGITPLRTHPAIAGGLPRKSGTSTCFAPLEEHCHNSKNTTFHERGKTIGRGDAIASKEQQHFSPLVAILENRRVTLFH
jgi:hypothetical protein